MASTAPSPKTRDKRRSDTGAHLGVSEMKRGSHMHGHEKKGLVIFKYTPHTWKEKCGWVANLPPSFSTKAKRRPEIPLAISQYIRNWKKGGTAHMLSLNNVRGNVKAKAKREFVFFYHPLRTYPHRITQLLNRS